MDRKEVTVKEPKRVKALKKMKSSTEVNLEVSLKKLEKNINLREKVTDLDTMGIIDPLDPNETRVILAMKKVKFEDTMSYIERK